MKPATAATAVLANNRIIVADTGPLIALARLEQLALLTSLFSAVHIPRTVLTEATAKRDYADAEPIHAFAIAHAQIGETVDTPLAQSLLSLLDEGETQALVLAKQLGCGVLMDEKRGRQVARHHGVPVVGVLGVLLQAKRNGQVERLGPMIERLQSSGYRLSPSLIEAVLTLAGES